MQALRELVTRRGCASDVDALQKRNNLWPRRVVRMASGPWGRPVGRASLALGAIVFLSWLGARSAQAPSPPMGQSDPRLASLVAVPVPAASPVHGSASAVASRTDAGNKTSDNANSGVLPDGRIVLNVANEQELCRLPGVGPSRSKKIIALRKRLGRYKSLRQLLRVRGIGPRSLKRLRPLLVLDKPPPAPDAGK